MGKGKVYQDRPSKVTMMLFQLEGGDHTLQEGFKTISAAMTRVLNQTGSQAAARTIPSLSVPVEDLEEIESELVEVPALTPTVSRAARKSVASPKILDLNLLEGTPPLKEFLSVYSGDDTSKRYLLIAYWLKQNLSIEEISKDHAHTCFRHMSWQTPKDASQPLHDMKNKRQWFHKGNVRGHFRLNHIGENAVTEILGNKA